MKKIILLNFIFLLITCSGLFARSREILITHGGRLNSEGCHNDKKKNSYHCHKKNSQNDKLEFNEKNVIIKIPPSNENPTIESRKLLRMTSKCLLVALGHQAYHV